MSFIAKHITHHDERLIYIARLHWVYLVKGFSWFFILACAGALLNWAFLLYTPSLPSQNEFFRHYSWGLLMDFVIGLIPLITGALIFLIYVFKMMGTEIALTNKRLIYKTGVIFVQSSEVEMSEVMEENVDNGLLGAFIGYGRIHLDCRFVGDFDLPTISHPYNLLRQMNKLRTAPPSEKPAL
jgi:hypothetical protein